MPVTTWRWIQRCGDWRPSEAGVLPSEKLIADMTRFNEELVKAGIMEAGEGLHPSPKGVRIRFSADDKRSVVGVPSRRRRSSSPATGSGK